MADSKISALAPVTDIQPNDDFVVARAGTTKRITGAYLASPWEAIVDLPLTVTTNWAMPAGWTNDGTKMIFGGAATRSPNKYALRVAQDCFIAEVKIWIPSTGRSLATQRIGMLVNWDGTNTGGATYLIQWANNVIGAAVAYVERDAVAGGPSVTISPAIGFNAWNTFRVCRSGMAATMYVNGIAHGTTRVDSHAANDKDQSWIALYGYGCDAHLKDFRVYRLRHPV